MELPPPVGRRAVLLLSPTLAMAHAPELLVVEVSTRIRMLPQELRLGPAEGLVGPAAANFDRIHQVPKTALRTRIGKLRPGGRFELERAMAFAKIPARFKPS